MLLHNKISRLALLTLLPFFLACNKDEDTTSGSTGGGNTNTETGPGTVTVDIANTSGMVNVDETGATSYVNSSNETFTVTMLKYYLSNCELFNDTGFYSVPDSYFLVDEADAASTKLELPSIPEGYYKGLRFMIGVDEDKYNELTPLNPASITGPLDPVNGMIWTWSTGYIHFKIEGTYGGSSAIYNYHIGGMNGPYAGQRMVEIYFGGDSLHVAGNHEAQIHMRADVQKIFSGSTTISIAAAPTIMTVNQNAARVADNYATMFEFDHLHN